MKRLLHYGIYVDPANETAVRRELGDIRVERRIGPLGAGRAVLWLAFERSQWPSVASIATRYGHRTEIVGQDLLREECVFTKGEVDNAELLAVVVNRSPLDFLGRQDGMIYDWTIAPTAEHPAPWCWQLSPRLMLRRHMPRQEVGIHQTIPLEILVSQRLFDSVGGLRDRRVQMGPVVAGGTTTDWFQLKTTRVMPPYDVSTTGVRRNHEHAPPTSPPTVVDMIEEGYGPAYRRTDVLDHFEGALPPITFTYELIGRWGPDDLARQVAPPQPRLVVSQVTRRELIASGVKQLNYVPVRWID